MDRTAIFVDAGYLFAEGSKLIAGEKLPRTKLDLDHDAMINLLIELNAQITGLPLLRIYWYDGASNGPTRQQLALASRSWVKLRLGFVNQHGEQKGVDSLVLTDLSNLSRNRAMADAILLTGDEDLRVGIEQAQELGIRVHLIGVAPVHNNQSSALCREADTVRELTLAEIESFLTTVPSSARSAAAPRAPEPTTLEGVARQVAGSLDADELGLVLGSMTRGESVPVDIDRRLLRAGSAAMSGTRLTSRDKRQLRAAFLDHCRSSATS